MNHLYQKVFKSSDGYHCKVFEPVKDGVIYRSEIFPDPLSASEAGNGFINTEEREIAELNKSEQQDPEPEKCEYRPRDKPRVKASPELMKALDILLPVKCLYCGKTKVSDSEGRLIDGSWAADNSLPASIQGKWICDFTCYAGLSEAILKLNCEVCKNVEGITDTDEDSVPDACRRCLNLSEFIPAKIPVSGCFPGSI